MLWVFNLDSRYKIANECLIFLCVFCCCCFILCVCDTNKSRENSHNSAKVPERWWKKFRQKDLKQTTKSIDQQLFFTKIKKKYGKWYDKRQNSWNSLNILFPRHIWNRMEFRHSKFWLLVFLGFVSFCFVLPSLTDTVR